MTRCMYDNRTLQLVYIWPWLPSVNTKSIGLEDSTTSPRIFTFSAQCLIEIDDCKTIFYYRVYFPIVKTVISTFWNICLKGHTNRITVTYVSVDKFAPSWIMALFCGRTFVKTEHCGSPNGTTAFSSTLFNNDEMQITNLSVKLWSNAVVLHISPGICL